MRTLIICLSLLFAGLNVQAQSQPQQPTPQQCEGTKADGERCRLKVKNGRFCHHHDPNRARCGHPKADGSPCRMPVKNAGDKCYHHKP